MFHVLVVPDILVQTVSPLQGGPMGCPATLLTNYQSTLCNIPEEQKSQLYVLSICNWSGRSLVRKYIWMLISYAVVLEADFMIVVICCIEGNGLIKSECMLFFAQGHGSNFVWTCHRQRVSVLSEFTAESRIQLHAGLEDQHGGFPYTHSFTARWPRNCFLRCLWWPWRSVALQLQLVFLCRYSTEKYCRTCWKMLEFFPQRKFTALQDYHIMGHDTT